MNVELQILSEANVEHYSNEPDVYANLTSKFVVLRELSLNDLREILHDFKRELVETIHELFSTNFAIAIDKFGLLGLNKRNVAQFMEHPVGLWPKAPSENATLKFLKRAPAVIALNAARLNENGMVGHRKSSKKADLASYLHRLDGPLQKKFFSSLFADPCDLDDVLNFRQGTSLDLMALEKDLLESTGVEEFLQTCIEKMLKNFSSIDDSVQNAKLHTTTYASLWFASYLTARGVWLIPFQIARQATFYFPKHLRPVQFMLSFPSQNRDFALSLMKDYLTPTANNNNLPALVALKLALFSNMWEAREPVAGPLITYKRVSLSESDSGQHASWAANRLWEAQLEFFGVSADVHPDSHAFVSGKRLVTKGAQPFEWVHRPNKRNLAKYGSWTGLQPKQFPDWMVAWARDIDELLPLFQVEVIRQKVQALDIWLSYLSVCDDPPKSFREIRRSEHINSGRRNSGCFRQFLLQNFPSDRHGIHTSAMRTLRQAWQLAAVNSGFDHKLANPIETSDTPFNIAPKHARTVRSALDPRVAEIITRKNLHEDMKFARELGERAKTCWRTVRDPESGVLKSVFFPAAPTMIHVILHTGMRGMQVRWLDTGEGDEHLYQGALIMTHAPIGAVRWT